jgi:3-oxoadipate enol-lactonase
MTQTLHANGINISYEVAGEGPWLIFSHSLGCSKTMWQSQFQLLAESFQVVRYDTRGHGQTDAPAGPYSLDLLAEDVKALCDALGIEQCHFVGLSMGGMIGQTVALKYPDLLLSLTLADTSSVYGPAALPFWQTRSQTALNEGMAPLVAPTMDRWFTAPFREAEPALMAEVRQWILDTPAQGYAACCLAIAAIDTTARLHEIKVPVLVIVGADDVATSPAMAEAIHAQIAGSQLLVLPSAAHIANVEQPEGFNEALQDFLAEARA